MTPEHKNLLHLCSRCEQKTNTADEQLAIKQEIFRVLTPAKIRELVMQADKGARLDLIKRALDTSKQLMIGNEHVQG